MSDSKYINKRVCTHLVSSDQICTDFICTYHLMEDYNDSLELYRVQLLQTFNLDIFDDKIISEKIDNLYSKLKDNLEIKQILNKLYKLEKSNIDLLQSMSTEDNYHIAFQLLFGYDYYYIFHKCYSKYIIALNLDILDGNNYFNELLLKF